MVSALARTNQKLHDLVRRLRTQDAVVSVKSAVFPARYSSGDRIECYADAELASGNAVGWWLEFRCENGSWVIESSVRINTEAGQDELAELPTRYAVDDAELVEEIDGAADMLIATAERLDLDKL